MGTTALRRTQVGANTLTDNEEASANKDGAANVASLRTLGSGPTQACAGSDSRLSDARTPVGTSLTQGYIWQGNVSNLAAAVAPATALDVLTQKGADIASAATTNIAAAAGSYVNITGSVTITALGTAAAGVQRTCQFSGALTLTYNATSLILPGAANIITVAGDVAKFISLGSGNWICVSYLRSAAGLAVSGSAGIVWAGAAPSSGLCTIGDGGAGGSLFVETASLNSSYHSGLGIDGSFASQISTVNITAYGVNSGGGYGSVLVFRTTNGTSVLEAIRFDQNQNLLLAAKLTKYNGIATVANGVPAIVATGRFAAQTAAKSSVASYTVGAADASFEVNANVLVTTATAHSFTVTVAYTDEGNTARTATLSFQQLAGGSPITSIANAGGAVPYSSTVLPIRCKAGTTITVATVGTFTTVAYNVESFIKQVG